MRKRKLTAADVWAIFAEGERQMKAMFAESDQRVEKFRMENERQRKEEEEKRKIEDEKRRIEEEERRKETDRRFKELGIHVAGISDSNGDFAEEYFYNSLKKKMHFAGIHFDSISSIYKNSKKAPDGKIIEDQFDIVMFNGNYIAIIEVKYKAENDYPKKMVERKIPNFKFLFPELAKNRKIYLGLASLSFSESVVNEAKKLGIGLLSQVGEVMETQTNWIRAY